MFSRFLLCSGFAAVVNLAVGYILYGVLGLADGLEFMLAVSAAFLSGMGVSFLLNRSFTFPASGRDVRLELRDFFMVSFGGMSLNSGLAFALDSWANEAMVALAPNGILPETIAHVLAVAVTAVYSFFAHKHVSFRARQNSNAVKPRQLHE